MPKNRSKRLRKKLRVGEFQEFGFLISFSLSSNTDVNPENAFVDRFLEEAIDAKGLSFGGSIGKASSGFVSRCKAKSVTNEHRLQVKEWLNVQAAVSKIKVGELENT